MSRPKQTPKLTPVRNPHHLPTKVCPVCTRAFTWRKKWARDWEQVVYCSDKCRTQSKTAP